MVWPTPAWPLTHFCSRKRQETVSISRRRHEASEPRSQAAALIHRALAALWSLLSAPSEAASKRRGDLESSPPQTDRRVKITSRLAAQPGREGRSGSMSALREHLHKTWSAPEREAALPTTPAGQDRLR